MIFNVKNQLLYESLKNSADVIFLNTGINNNIKLVSHPLLCDSNLEVNYISKIIHLSTKKAELKNKILKYQAELAFLKNEPPIFFNFNNDLGNERVESLKVLIEKLSILYRSNNGDFESDVLAYERNYKNTYYKFVDQVFDFFSNLDEYRFIAKETRKRLLYFFKFKFLIKYKNCLTDFRQKIRNEIKNIFKNLDDEIDSLILISSENNRILLSNKIYQINGKRNNYRKT